MRSSYGSLVVRCQGCISCCMGYLIIFVVLTSPEGMVPRLLGAAKALCRCQSSAEGVRPDAWRHGGDGELGVIDRWLGVLVPAGSRHGVPRRRWKCLNA